MIATLSTVAWMILRPLANHLWQSTFCAVVAGLLTLALRNNRAQVRYWLWLIAALKFLVPFSLLIWAATLLAFHSNTTKPHPELSVVMQEITQPFTSPIIPSAAAPSTSDTAGISLIPALLFDRVDIRLCRRPV